MTCLILLFFIVHRLMGISYFGASLPSQPLTRSTQALIIIWNLVSLIFFVATYNRQPGGNGQVEIVEAFIENQNSFSPLIVYVRIISVGMFTIFR